MEWKKFKDEKPPIAKTILIWRSSKNHQSYGVAKLENKDGKMIWRSFSGNALKIEEKDYWLEFPSLTVSETYI